MIRLILEKSVPYAIAFSGALGLTLILTPLVRELNRRLGMVDKPDPRRINKVPIPRGGGLALFLGVGVSYILFGWLSGAVVPLSGLFWKMFALGAGIAALGLADDRFNLNPRVKLLGQVVIAVLVWSWAGLGFARLCPALPAGLDCALTVFWIVGAVNAFNLIDGLDGLASGLALIATIGMAGSLFLDGQPHQTLPHFAFAGGLVGFLRYNYNPASVFLGDCGSMFIGFTLSTLPLVTQTQDSFLVSVGVPLLAMGVPIFDTALAILRRSLRNLLHRRNADEKSNGKVMTADSDHLHHRILRSVGLNQRKAAWTLYALAAFLIGAGLVGVLLRSHAAGFWLFALTVASVVVFRDMARIELFDAGRLLSAVARDRSTRIRRRFAFVRVPFYVAFDVFALIAVYFFCAWVLRIPLNRTVLRVGFPVQIIVTFCCLVLFRIYRVDWSRAMLFNYSRLLQACSLGAIVTAVLAYYAPMYFSGHVLAMMLAYMAPSFMALAAVRTVRGIVRDLFYTIDCRRLRTSPEVSRVLVYGVGLRYRAFRRELVRSTGANARVIVGLIDDDLLLRGAYVGGARVYGTLVQAPGIIRATGADAVVITFAVSDEWLAVIRQILAPTGVKVTLFTFSEKEIA
ncbi:MAG: hypothetical protein ACI4R9_04725 [Kiritimatiellia bacterium]